MNPQRRLLALAAIAACSSAWLSGCATAPSPAPITDTVARTAELSTLSRLLADAGLADTLRGAGPYTLFAPTDEAFRALPAKTLSDLAADPALLKSVLTYHVVPGRLMAADARNAALKTVQGKELAVSRAGTFVTVEDAVVQQTDIAAANGVVHIIDKVLMPPR